MELIVVTYQLNRRFCCHEFYGLQDRLFFIFKQTTDRVGTPSFRDDNQVYRTLYAFHNLL